MFRLQIAFVAVVPKGNIFFIGGKEKATNEAHELATEN